MNLFARIFPSFTSRMVLAALLMHALLVPVLALGIHKIVADDIKDEFVNYVRSRSQQFGTLLEDRRSPATAQAMLQDWVLSGEVAYADLTSPTGAVIPGNDPQDTAALKFIEDFSFGEHGDDVYFVSMPIGRTAGELRGTLRLGFDERPVKQRIAMLYQRGALLIIGYLAASLLLAWGAGTLLSRSIRQLRDATRRVAIGHTNEALDIKTGIVEVSSLTQDLEFMRQELVRHGEELRTLAYFDSLTGLGNRLLFSQRLADALAVARRHDRKLAILYTDIDRFKRVNDTLGHAAGDQLLCGVSSRLQDCLRGSDLIASAGDPALGSVARLGGDEFTILITDISQEGDAGKVAHRILEALREPIPIGDHQIYATLSMGIAIFPIDGEDPATLLKNADTAMYSAKQNGKNHFQYYTKSMNEIASARLALEGALHRAVELNQLVLHYQPQVDIRTAALTGVEALVRWQHPDRGLIPPGDFISIAEECGLIMPIGEWVIRTACAQLKAWSEMGLPLKHISVNVSAKQFQQPSFIRVVKQALDDFGLQPGALVIEITETALMSNEEEAIGRLAELRALGVGLSIDDFGTGYSSLAYLKRFPVQALKIDRSFIQDLPENSHNAAITHTIIALAQSLNLNVIAEGVETNEQRQFLVEQGCREMQGCLIAPALPGDVFVEFLRHQPGVLNEKLRVLTTTPYEDGTVAQGARALIAYRRPRP